jgi:AcrR family transcriptional regulator
VRRTRRSGDERRDEIARAAFAIAGEQGAGAISVAAVAHRVGVAPSALYRHYPNKDAMIDDALSRLGAQVAANMARARATTGAPLDALGDFLARHIDFVLANRGFPLMIFSDAVFQNPARRQRVAAMLAAFRGAVADLVREAQRRGEARRELDPEAAAFVFFGLFMPAGFHFHLAGGRFDLSGYARRAWAVYLAGLRNDAPARPARGRRRAATQERPS